MVNIFNNLDYLDLICDYFVASKQLKSFIDYWFDVHIVQKCLPEIRVVIAQFNSLHRNFVSKQTTQINVLFFPLSIDQENKTCVAFF
jgi:3-methyladenine DNA glycosylase AlkD